MSDTEPEESPPERKSGSVAGQVLQLGKESFVYGLAGAAGGVVGVIALPLLTSKLSPSEYALIATASVFVSLLSSVSALGLDIAALRWLNDEEGEKEPGHIMSSWFWTQLFVSLGVGAILGLLASSISSWLFDDPAATAVLLLAALLIPLQTFRAVAFGWFRFRRQPVRAALFLGGGAALSVILMTVAVWVLNTGVVGALFGQVATGGVVAVSAILIMRHRLKISEYSRRVLVPMLRFGLPLMPAPIMTWITTSSDRILLAAFSDAAQVGIYAVAVMVTGIMMVLTGAFTTAFAPFAFSIREQANVRETLASVAAWASWVFLCAAAFMSVFAPLLVQVLAAEDYAEAASAIPYLAFAQVAAIMGAVFMIGPTFEKKTSGILISLISAAVLSVGLNILLIPVLGFQGSAIASLLALLARAAILYWYNQQLFPIRFPWWQILTSTLAAIAVVGAAQFFSADSLTGFVGRTALLLIMLLVPVATGMLKNPWKAARERVTGRGTGDPHDDGSTP